MTNQEKFEGFKENLINENERKYGAEIRAKYSNKTINEYNASLKGLTQEQYDESEQLRLALEATLKSAIKTGDPTGRKAWKACDLHRKWLCVFAPKHYNKKYHKNLGQMYVSDERFKAYYEKIAPGCAKFLSDSIDVYCN